MYAVRYIALGFFVIGNMGFAYEYFAPPDKFRKPFILLSGLTAAAFMIYAVSSSIYGSDNAATRMIIVLPTFCTQVYGLLTIANSSAYKANRLNQFYSVTVLAQMAEALLLGMFLNRFPNLGVVTQTFFVIVQTVLLSDRYSSAINENELLNSLNRTKTEFLQDMNHELRTPLSVIATGITYAENQIGCNGNMQKARETLTIAHEETLRVGRMLDGMATMAALSKTIENRERLDLTALLRESAEAFRLRLEAQGVQLRLLLAPDLPDVFVVRDQFVRVLANILSNAAEHTRNGSVTVSAALNHPCITVSVSDTGDGVLKEIFPRLFDRGVSGRGGTGYGLFISKSIVEAHGGSIRAESEPGKGCTVIFTVPVYGGQEFGHYSGST